MKSILTNSTPSLWNFFALKYSMKRQKLLQKNIRNPLKIAGFYQGIADIFWQSKEEFQINVIAAKKFHNDGVPYANILAINKISN